MRLNRFLVVNRVGHEEAAELFGVHKSSIQRYTKGVIPKGTFYQALVEKLAVLEASHKPKILKSGKRVSNAATSLPVGNAKFVEARKLSGLSYESTAAVLNCTAADVHSIELGALSKVKDEDICAFIEMYSKRVDTPEIVQAISDSFGIPPAILRKALRVVFEFYLSEGADFREVVKELG
jgi:hypothetical protein